jgi:hypothetical protein
MKYKIELFQGKSPYKKICKKHVKNSSFWPKNLQKACAENLENAKTAFLLRWERPKKALWPFWPQNTLFRDLPPTLLTFKNAVFYLQNPNEIWIKT